MIFRYDSQRLPRVDIDCLEERNALKFGKYENENKNIEKQFGKINNLNFRSFFVLFYVKIIRYLYLHEKQPLPVRFPLRIVFKRLGTAAAE